MYLFSRQRRLHPARGRAGIAYAIEAGARASELSGMEIGVWAEAYGPGLGTVSWSTMVPDLVTLDQAMVKMAEDDGFQSMLESGDENFVGAAEDLLYEVVAGEADPDQRPMWAGVVQGRCNSGRIAEGMALGVEIAQRASAITGVSTMFLAARTGTYAGVGFITGYADIAEVEAAEAKLGADADWVALIDTKAGAAYAPEATQSMFRRLA